MTRSYAPLVVSSVHWSACAEAGDSGIPATSGIGMVEPTAHDHEARSG